MTSSHDPQADAAAVARCHKACDQVRDELGKVVVGQDEVIEQVLVALLARGHALLQGAPGLAKTRLLHCLAEVTGSIFARIQFTPDLTPGDLAGGVGLREDVEAAGASYRFLPGPIFANMVLADEINQAPPRTQAALLAAMDQGRLTADGTTRELPSPFFVLATRNRFEEEGSYPLSQAQRDRFLLDIKMDYPSDEEELEMARRVADGGKRAIEPVITSEVLSECRAVAKQVPVRDSVSAYATALVRATRPGKGEAVASVDRWVQWGAGPRGVTALIVAAKARAMLRGRLQAEVADVQAVAGPALRHRIAGNHAAEANALTSDSLIHMLLEAVPAAT